MGLFNIIISHTVEEEPLVKTDNVTRGMIRQRAVELAVMNGRPALETSKSDWEAAKLEHTGKTQPPDNLPRGLHSQWIEISAIP